jgi:hypothetical protein
VVVYCVAVLLVVMEWTAAITGDRVGLFLDFFSKEKKFRATIFCKAEIQSLY